MVATGLKSGKLLIWDIRTQEIVNTLTANEEAAVTRICFSENGYQMASCGKKESAVQLWDLRKLTVQPPINVKTEAGEV